MSVAVVQALRQWLQAPGNEDHGWPRPPIGPDPLSPPTPHEVTIRIGGIVLSAAALVNWWDAARDTYAPAEPYDTPSRTVFSLPPMRVAEGLDTCDIVVKSIEMLPDLMDAGVERALLKELKRLVMAEGFTSVVLENVSVDFYKRVLNGQYGWLDVLVNRDAGRSAPSKERPLADAAPLTLTWSPPATRLWARMTGDERAEWESVLRWASALQDWLAQDEIRPGRFYWEEENAVITGALVLLAPLNKTPVWEAVHGLPDAALKALGNNGIRQYCLHVRSIRINRGDGDGKLLALINAFLVELARSRALHLTLDGRYINDEEWDAERLFLLGHVATADGFVYPTWQRGLGPWPYFYVLQAARTYENDVVYFAPLLPNTDRAFLRYADREGHAALVELEKRVKEDEDERETIILEDKGARAEREPSDRPTKRVRTEARCFICMKLHAKTSGIQHAIARICSKTCYDMYSQGVHL